MEFTLPMVVGRECGDLPLFECGMIVEGAVIEGFLPLFLASEKRCVHTSPVFEGIYTVPSAVWACVF